MPTPAEKKALLFIGVVALLGGGVRFWQSRSHGDAVPSHAGRAGHTDAGHADAAHADAGHADVEESNADPSTPARRGRSSKRRSAQRGGRERREPDRTHSTHFSAPADDPGDVTEGPATIDLDRATMADITSLGVVTPGVARMIVEDRDNFGPFGSIQALERIPYLSRSSIEKLAPRVTFSLLPRPKNTVLQGRTPPPALPIPRRRPKTQ